jgi:putative transposase
MEDLTLKGMQNLWGNKIKQLGLGQLTMFIKYKAENQGNTERTSLLSECNKQSIACKKACKKIFSKIDRFYPSSKTCCNCGNKKNLLLSDRIYNCEKCNIKIDRDINAAINILLEGIKKLIIEKELNPSIINIGDLKDYLIEKLNDTSKVVDEKKISDNLLRKPQH